MEEEESKSINQIIESSAVSGGFLSSSIVKEDARSQSPSSIPFRSNQL